MKYLSVMAIALALLLAPLSAPLPSAVRRASLSTTTVSASHGVQEGAPRTRFAVKDASGWTMSLVHRLGITSSGIGRGDRRGEGDGHPRPSAPVAEPGTLALLGAGLIALASMRWGLLRRGRGPRRG